MPISDNDQGVSESYIFGGVDSRSNPLNMPADRAIRCKNWVPTAAGWLEFRLGYTKVPTTGATVSGAIHSIFSYTLYDGTRYLLLGSGNSLYRLKLSDGTMILVGNLT